MKMKVANLKRVIKEEVQRYFSAQKNLQKLAESRQKRLVMRKRQLKRRVNEGGLGSGRQAEPAAGTEFGFTRGRPSAGALSYDSAEDLLDMAMVAKGPAEKMDVASGLLDLLKRGSRGRPAGGEMLRVIDAAARELGDRYGASVLAALGAEGYSEVE